MSYDSGSEVTMGVGGGGGGLAPTAPCETDTFTSPPFRGGGGRSLSARSPYNPFGNHDHADVVAEHYEQARRLSQGGGASPMATSQFANTMRRGSGGAGGGEYQLANAMRRDGGGASPTGTSQQYQFADTSRRGSGDGVGGGGAADMSVGPGGHCSPRHPTHFEPSSLVSSDTK